jgi:phosphoenolpyruvate phosphomutase
MKKTKKFKELLKSENLEFIMEAHNGITAQIVERTGFKGIWASGLTMSTSLGVRDNNELSWSQVISMLEFMNDATDLPILVDGDTGYGNFNNVRRLVKFLERIGIAGVCIEDKVFPKNNSFQESAAQQLISISEFCGKIRAAKDTQIDADFSFIARTESFISGKSLNEVLDRAYAYEEAGADALVIHSKKSDSIEIDQFMDKWEGKAPIIVIPTKYYKTETNHFRKKGIKMVIWANHLMRALVPHLESVAETIFKDESVINIEPRIAAVARLFDYQNLQELEEAEKKYSEHNIPPRLEKDESFGIIPLKKNKNDWHVFIIKHKTGHLGFPKGHRIDIHEKPKAVAERELKEETGLLVKMYYPIEPLHVNYECVSYGKHVNKLVTFFVADVYGDVRLCPQEVEEGMWVDLQEARRMFLFENMKQLIEVLQKELEQKDVAI